MNQSASRARKRVFIVHGRDLRAKESAENLVQLLRFEPVVLDRVVKHGSTTVVEAFEKAVDVVAALVLLTPDDVGGLRKRGPTQPRARQNVIFELGYVMGRLGRGRVICLLKGEIEKPSDIEGVYYHRFKVSVDECASKVAEELRAITKIVEPSLEGADLYSNTTDPEFLKVVARATARAKKMTVIATGINEPLMNHVRTAIQRARDKRCRVEIYVADPARSGVEVRLIEEELGTTNPPLGKTGLENRLETLMHACRDTGVEATVALFGHYPTLAVLIMDGEYFTYPYGYALLGTFSPVLHFTARNPAHAPMITFLKEHCDRVRKAAVPQSPSRSHRRPDQVDELSFALFVVPDGTSEFYRLGTSVLGYDVRESRAVETRWKAKVGDAAAFGFHLTVCDALYFANEVQVAIARSQVRFLAKQWHAFWLSNLVLKHSWPDARSIAFGAHDQSGALEAFHSELVTRIYRDAASSNYSVGIKQIVRGGQPERHSFMLQRYKSPYVLKEYTPHFTLLTNVEPHEQDATVADLETHRSGLASENGVYVDHLAIMSRRDGRWVIVEEVKLGQ